VSDLRYVDVQRYVLAHLKPLACPACGDPFERVAVLVTHLKERHDFEMRPDDPADGCLGGES
jgi:hypothetical protein